MMDCRRFERQLEALSGGTLAPADQRLAVEHAAECDECGELLALAKLPLTATPAPWRERFLEAVVAQTSQATCAGTEANLAALVDGSLAAEESVLLAEHVAGCRGCGELVSVLRALDSELPRLAEVRPDAGFVEAVLKRTLPVNVQLRRWWAQVWPRWLRRPRFASELAYVGSLVIVLVVATPGSPLEAVPQRALAAVSRPAGSRLDLGQVVAVPVDAVQTLAGSPGVLRLGDWIEAGVGTASQADEVVGGAAESLATFWRGAASLMGNDGANAASAALEIPETPETNEENP